MRRRGLPVLSVRFVCACALSVVSTVSGASGQAAPPRVDAAETVNVEVKLVPFYAVDSQGKPVTDLKPEEIEVRVDGRPVAIESFDRYAIGGTSGPRSSRTAPIPSRNVFLLFDTAFSTPVGFRSDQQLAARMLGDWPATDRLTLLVHSTRASLENRLGPVLADGKGKREILAAIQSLQPEIRRVGTAMHPEEDLGPSDGGANRAPSQRGNPDQDHGIPKEQMYVTFDGLQGTARAEYASIAQSYAASLGDLAGQLRHISGPKVLLVFTQGFNSKLYFDGDTGLPIGMTGLTWTDVRRQQPLSNDFRQPLAALADSGTMTLFVNTDRSTAGGDASAVLGHMAQSSGGLLLEGWDAREMEARLEGSTSAYYEAGFRPVNEDSRASVQVAVRRPGVRVWAPASLQLREPYRELSAAEKRQLAIDLVAGGPDAQSVHAAVHLKVRNLDGRVTGRAATGAPRLRFEAAWPAEAANRKLDLYNVLLVPPGKGSKGQVLAFDQREGTAGTDRGPLEATLEGKGARVWGILAVDPESEQAWVRRLMLQAPGRSAP